MKKTTKKWMAFMLFLVMLFDAAPLPVIAEEQQQDSDLLTAYYSEPKQLDFTLPEYTLTEDEFTVSPVKDMQSLISAVNKPVPMKRGLLKAAARNTAEQNQQADAATASITGYAAFDIKLTEGAHKAESYSVPVSFDAPIDVFADNPDRNASIVRVSCTLYHFQEDGSYTVVKDAQVNWADNLLTGFTFTTDGFSAFLLKYTVDFVYRSAEGKICINFENLQENSNELSHISYDKIQKVTMLPVADILADAPALTENVSKWDSLYAVYLHDGTAKEEFDKEFFSQAAVSIEGKGVEYSEGAIRLTGDVQEGKVTFTSGYKTLEVEIANYLAPVAPIEHAFHGIGDTASVSDILETAGIVSSNNIAVSDETLLTIEGDTLTTLAFFNEAALTVTLEDSTEVAVKLTNPEFISAGQPVVIDGVGSFQAAVELQPGALLSVSSGEEDQRVADAAQAALGEDVDVIYYDVKIVDAEGAKIETGATVTLDLGIGLPDVPEGKIAKVTGKVFHATDDGVELLDAQFNLAEGQIKSVTFTTDSFSLFGIAYTVDFVSAEVNKAWSWPGEGSYRLADIMTEIGVTGDIESVDLVRTDDQGGSDKALYLEEREDGWYLVSEEAFVDTFVLTVVVDGVSYHFTVTDGQVDNRITAEAYFLNTDGTRTSQAETESGNTLNARVLLSNSNSNSNEEAYVKVSLSGLDNYVTLNESFTPNSWDHITFRDMTTGQTFTMGVYYNTSDNSITYRVPPGATGIAALSFTAPNGITEDNKTLTLKPTLVDSSFSAITPAENDSISGPASGKWTSDFAWDPVQKYVNNAKENMVVVTSDNGTPKINSWLHYDYTANSQNRTETGVRWTDEAIIEDTLTLPAHMSFTGTYTYNKTEGRIYIDGASAPDNILFGLTLKPNMTITDLDVRDRNKIYYRIKVTNPNRPDASSDLSAEMDNISYITELNAAGITLDPDYITAGYYGEEIINAVSVTEKPCKGNDDDTSQDQVQTKTKEDEGFTVNKESPQDGQYVQAGATIEYTIRVTNTGTVTIAAEDSVVSDMLPSAVYLTDAEIARLQSVYGDKITIDGNNITFRTGELAPNAVSQLVIQATVRDSRTLEQWGYTNESTITNTASYRGLSDYVASKLHAGTITSEKTSDKTSTTLQNGQSVNFTLTAKNETAYNYTGDVSLIDYLPKYLLVTIYDANGDDITETTYSQTNITYETGCYVKDSDGSLVPAKVVISGDGITTIEVHKDGLAANSTYSIVLTATYDESKVDGNVDDNGNITYTNRVTVNNSQSHTDITAKVGKVDLEKYVSNATVNGLQATPPYCDGTIVTYTIHVTNDTQNPYTHNIVVTDTLPKGLVPMGLTVNGTEYTSWQAFVNAFGWNEQNATILDGSGTAQSVKVVQAYNGLKITWTIPNPVDGNYITSRDISYQAFIKTDELVNQTTGLQELENKATAVGREDKAIIVVDVKGVEISKKIVGPNGELFDTIEIGPSATVTYELTIDNPEHLETTVTGITDYLPQGGPQSVFPLGYWVLGDTVLVDETTAGKSDFFTYATPYSNNDANYGKKYWFDNEHYLRFGDINVTSSQEKLVQRITLKYPDDPAVLHTMFVDTTWGRQQKNKYSITGMPPVEVDHTEVVNKKFYAQKSVIGLAKDVGYNYVALSSKDLFNIGDVTDVFYMVIVANTGTGTLHVNSLTDILPPELQFVGIANSDYNAGTHSYGSIREITTYDQNNNPNYVIPAGYSGLSGVKVTAAEPTGNTVLFTLNEGAGVNLPEKHVLAFDVQCKIKDGVTLTNGQPITNTIQADLDSDAALSRMPIATQKTHDDAIQNNGGCTVVSNDGTHQIAESTVTIHPSNAAVPGILKKAIAYKAQADTEWTALNDNTTNINSQSNVKWRITLYNDGAVPIDGYTLSDAIYEHHSFSSIESFTINGSAKDMNAAPFTGYTTTKEGQYNKYVFTFPAESGYEIPAGGSAELVLVTSFTSGQYQGQLDNKAIFSPIQEWDANRVTRGQLEKNADGTAYTGVSSMDYVNMLGDGATMSYKVAAEKGYPANKAYGYDIATGRNYITVDDTNAIITYTNHVQNLSNATFKQFVMIDRMPEIGDTGVVNAHEQRGSEFSIGFANALNLSLIFRNSEGTKSIALTNEDYTLEFSNNTSFTTEDWAGTSAWNASAATAKSFRLKLNPGTLTAKINALENSTLMEAVFPSMWVLEVSYDGKLSADGTPGQYAWNSFGYHYTTAADVNLSAEPAKAGVRLKPLPVLKKQVVDNQGVDQGIDTSVSFTFNFYEGAHTLDQVASLTPIWETTLYQGQAVQLLAQKTVGGVTTGHFTEGQYYTVVEVPTAGYNLVGYEKDGLKQTTEGYCVFRYSNELNTTIVCQNQISGFAPEAEKVLYAAAPRTLQNQEFTFELLPLTNVDLNNLSQVEVIGTLLQQASNDASGHVQFDTIEYSAAGTYYYLMREASGNDSTVVYDDTKYLVKVEVSQVGALFSAIGSYYKVTDSDENDPIKGIQALSANTVPIFINTESTQIRVEKVWAGEVTTGSATMVLYRSTTAPTDTFDVTVNATLSGTPVGSATITATFTGEGDTQSVVLGNGNWSDQVALKRGVNYTVTYTTNKPDKITFTSPTTVSGITDPTTLTVTANAVAADQYAYTFTVPSAQRPANNKGSVRVTMNGTQATLSNANDWTATFTLTEETAYSYTAIPGDGFVTAVSPSSGNGTASASDSKNISLTLTNAPQTMNIPVSVNWDDTPDAGTTVTVTFTANGQDAQSVMLNGTPWSATKTLNRLNDGGNLITWNVNAEVTGADNASVSGTPATISGSGTVELTGVVARGMNLTVNVSKDTFFNAGQWDLYDKDLNYLSKIDGFTVGYLGNGTSYSETVSNLPTMNSDGKLYYGITCYSVPYKVTTNATDVKTGIYNGNSVIYIGAQAGDVTVTFEKIYGADFVINSGSHSLRHFSTFTASLPSTFLLIADGSGTDVHMRGAAETFADASVGGSGTPFTVIQAKDLPADAVVASDITGYEQTITDNGSYTWTNLPLFDETGHRIYYYVVEKTASANASSMSVRYGYTYNTANDANSGISVVTVTNTTTAPPKGDLRITKAVTVDGNSTSTNLADGTYNFTITGPENYNHTASITVTGGVATSTIDLTDLTLGDYTITETGSTDGHATLSGRAVTGTGSNSGDNAIVLTVTASSTVENTIAAFTNNVNTGTATTPDTVTVNKTDGTSALTGAKFALYTDAQCTGTPIKTYDLTSASSFAISTNDNYLASYLPANSGGTTTLYLKEIEAPANHRLDSTVYTVTITKSVSGLIWNSTENKYIDTTSYDIKINNSDDPLTVVNTPLGSISVTKTVTGSYTTTTDTYPITIKKDNKYVDSNSQLVDDDPQLTVTAGQTLTINDLSVGDYVVTEGAVSKTGYEITTTYTVGGTGAVTATASVTKGNTAAVGITNHYRDAQLVIKKTVTGPALADALAKITFTIEDVTTGITDAEKTATITIRGSTLTTTETYGSVTLTSVANGIKPDHTYKVTETIDDTLTGYKWKSVTTTIVTGNTTTSGTTTDATVTLTNGDTSSGEIDFANTYGDLIDVSGTKTWRVSNGVTPDNTDITLQLQRTAKPVTNASVWETVSAEPTWSSNTYTFSRLDKYNDSNVEYEYRVSEVSFKIGTVTYTIGSDGIATPDDNTKPVMKMTQSGNNFTNEELTVRHATKTWVDDDNAGGLRPESITFTLSATVGGTALAADQLTALGISETSKTIQPNNAGEWPSADWTNLPMYTNAGELITYDVQETAVANYTQTAKVWDEDTKTWAFTNTFEGISISVTKQWKKDGVDKTFAEAKSIEFTLYQKLTPTSSGSGTSEENRVYSGYNNGGVGTVTYDMTNSRWNTVTIQNLPLTVTETTGDGAAATTVTYNASYYVVETLEAADAGYVLATTYQLNAQTAVPNANGAVATANGDKITIINTETAGVELPATGGPGTLVYTVTGLSLMSVAVWMLLRRRKEQQN